jgi:hypothetical protein
MLVPAAAALFLTHVSQPHSSKQMTVINPKPLGVQYVVSLLQLKLGYACDIFNPTIQSQEKVCSSWSFHVDDRS